jgi:hypothetical protein
MQLSRRVKTDLRFDHQPQREVHFHCWKFNGHRAGIFSSGILAVSAQKKLISTRLNDEQRYKQTGHILK